MSKTDDAPTGVTEDAFDFLEWLESGTIARRQVVIYNDHEAFEAFVKVDERLAKLGYSDSGKPASKGKDAPLGGDPNDAEIDALLDERDALLARMQASKATWTVRAVSQPEAESTFDVVPVPKRPVPPKESAPQPVQDKFQERAQAWVLAAARAEDDRKLAVISIAVVGIETARGSADGVTFDQLKAMREKPHGAQWIERLHGAVSAATNEDVAPPVPS